MKIEESEEIRIVKKANDPCGIPRVSIGGGLELGGIYCVYRGTKEQAIACLMKSLAAMEAMAEYIGDDAEPDIQPDDGKKYA